MVLAAVIEANCLFQEEPLQAGTDLGSAGLQAILVLGAPSRCDQFGCMSEMRKSMPLLCVPLKHLSFVVPTLVLYLP